MTIKTYSAFTYGHTITDENKFINFNEGTGELTAEIEIGSYTLDAFKDAISNALNGVNSSTVTYTTSIDRNTRKITIAGDATFDLLVATGSHVGADAYPLMGFIGDDRVSGVAYESNEYGGGYFEPQFLLQKYVAFDDNVKTTQATVNQSASGKIEVVSYGAVRYMECNVTFQTNISQGKGSYLKNDPSGYTNLRNFMIYLVTKAPVEFIPDLDNQGAYTDCLLESSRSDKKGVSFKLKELYSKGFAEYYESEMLTFRELL